MYYYTEHGLRRNLRTVDYANIYMNMRKEGIEPNDEELKMYYDAVNRWRQAHYIQYGNYGDGRGHGIATIDGFVELA